MRFEGKTVLVTGGARGMGKNHCLNFAKEGADVIVNDVAEDISGISFSQAKKSELDKTVEEIRGLGSKAIGIVADISKDSQVKEMVEQAVAEFGRIDILVNNAGVFVVGPLVNTTIEQIDALIDINLKGVINCCRHVIPHMARQKYGKIINILSGAALYAEPAASVYSASKYGVKGLTEALAAEVSHYNINVNSVVPGAVYTPMLVGQMNEVAPNKDPMKIYLKFSSNQHFFRRPIEVQDLTNAVLFLASDEAKMITSQCLAVTNGFEKKQPAQEPYFEI